MKKTILFLLLSLIILLTACENVDVSKISDQDLERLSEKAISCKDPYIRYGASCCLDQNKNNICDKDEQKSQEKPQDTALPQQPATVPQSEEFFSKLTLPEGEMKSMTIKGFDWEIGVSNFNESSLMLFVNGMVTIMKPGDEWTSPDDKLTVEIHKLNDNTAILIISGVPSDPEVLHVDRIYKDGQTLAWKFDKLPNGNIVETYGDGTSEIRVSNIKTKLYENS